jgi:hypothetical protein
MCLQFLLRVGRKVVSPMRNAPRMEQVLESVRRLQWEKTVLEFRKGCEHMQWVDSPFRMEFSHTSYKTVMHHILHRLGYCCELHGSGDLNVGLPHHGLNRMEPPGECPEEAKRVIQSYQGTLIPAQQVQWRMRECHREMAVEEINRMMRTSLRPDWLHSRSMKKELAMEVAKVGYEYGYLFIIGRKDIDTVQLGVLGTPPRNERWSEPDPSWGRPFVERRF